MTELESLKDTAMKTAIIYLNDIGLKPTDTEYICEAGTIDIVFTEDDALIFARVDATAGNTLPDEIPAASYRAKHEMIAINYLTNHDLPSSRVRFDTIRVAMVSENRALICHHRDALGTDREQQIDRSTETKRIMDKNKQQPAKAMKPKAKER